MLNGRAEERRAFVAEVDVLHAGRPAPKRLWGKNLSEKGMFLQVGHGFRVGQRLSLRFDLNGTEVHIPSAEVVWVRSQKEGVLEAGAGLRFEDIKPADREKMRTYILETDVDSGLPGALKESVKPVSVSDITEVPQTRAGFAASLLPLKSPRPVTMRPSHRSVVPNLTHAVTLLRKGPVLSTPPVHPSMHSFLEPRESELRNAKAVTTPQTDVPENNTLVNSDQLFSDESPSLYEQETAILNNGVTPMGSLAFEDQPPGLRALDGQEHPTKNESRSRKEPEEPAFLHYAKDIKKEQRFEAGDLSAVDLPNASPRQAIYRRKKKTSPLISTFFFVVMAGVGFFLLWRPSPPTAYEFDVPSEKGTQARLVLSEDGVVTQDTPAEKKTSPKTAPVVVPSPTASTPKKVKTKTEQPAPKAQDNNTDLAQAAPVEIEKVSGKKIYTPQLVTEYGRLHLGITGGKVVRSFGLIRPARVVVDLEGAKHPGNITFKVEKHGIKKVRIGRPDGRLVRVVIITEGERRPQAISSVKRKSKLSVAWQ